MKRLLLLLCGCQGALDQRLDVVDAPRVLAIAANPPEVTPGATTQVSALVVSPSGTLSTQPAWSLCTAPKAPTEDNAVSTGCTDGSGLTMTTDTVAVPMDACQLFGPDVPPGGFRPRDPDPTGGYYQPVRADAADAGIAFGFARITCNLPSAPGDVAHEYQMSYVANQTPVLGPLVVPQPAANTDVTISTTWNEPETYLYYDPRSQTLVSRRESMRVSWFTSGGELAVDATQVGEDDPATGASTTWHVPGPGTYYLWAVLRDSRGGIAWTDQTITVP